MLRIETASLNDLGDLAILFDAYRVFYKQSSDVKAAKQFLENRFSNKDSIVFLAYENNIAVGFVQLYRTFSSVTLEPFYILNDLFVSKNSRGKGIGEALLLRAKEHCSETKYKGLQLETAKDNPAQKLYEKLGWKKDVDFLHYFWTCPKSE